MVSPPRHAARLGRQTSTCGRSPHSLSLLGLQWLPQRHRNGTVRHCRHCFNWVSVRGVCTRGVGCSVCGAMRHHGDESPCGSWVVGSQRAVCSCSVRRYGEVRATCVRILSISSHPPLTCPRISIGSATRFSSHAELAGHPFGWGLIDNRSGGKGRSGGGMGIPQVFEDRPRWLGVVN